MPATATREDLQFHMGDRLRKAREHTGADAKEFASRLGISRDSVRSYEKGDTRPRRPVLAAWALTSGFPVEWLEFGECPPRDSNPESADYDSVATVLELRPKRAA